MIKLPGGEIRTGGSSVLFVTAATKFGQTKVMIQKELLDPHHLSDNIILLQNREYQSAYVVTFLSLKLKTWKYLLLPH